MKGRCSACWELRSTPIFGPSRRRLGLSEESFKQGSQATRRSVENRNMPFFWHPHFKQRHPNSRTTGPTPDSGHGGRARNPQCSYHSRVIFRGIFQLTLVKVRDTDTGTGKVFVSGSARVCSPIGCRAIPLPPSKSQAVSLVNGSEFILFNGLPAWATDVENHAQRPLCTGKLYSMD